MRFISAGWKAREAGESKNLVRLIWHNSWPVLGLMFLNFLVGYADVYVAGLLSSDVQAAVGFISQQYFILIIVGNALGIGTVALVSRATGKGSHGQVLDLTRQSLLLTALVGVVLCLGARAGAPHIITLLDPPEGIQSMVTAYLKIYAIALPFNYMVIVSGAVFRAVGSPFIAFQIMAVATLFNIGGNFALVFGPGPFPKLGFSGIAWSTAASMLVGFLGVSAFFCRAYWRRLWSQKWRLSRETAASIAKISWPAAFLQVAWNFGNLAIYHFLSHLDGKNIAAMAAYTNGLRLEALTFMPAFALNMAAAVLVGQNLGAGSPKLAKKIGWIMAAAGALILSSLAAFLFWIAPQLAGMLTSDPDVWRETVRYLRINLVVAPFMVFSVVLGGAMQGAGDTRGVMRVIVLAIWGVRIPLAGLLCFAAGWGALGVWLAMDASMVFQALLMTRKYRKGSWMEQAPKV